MIRHSACVAGVVVHAVAVGTVAAAVARVVAGGCWDHPVGVVVAFALLVLDLVYVPVLDLVPVPVLDLVPVPVPVPVLAFDYDPGFLGDDDAVAAALVVSAAAGGRFPGGKVDSHSRTGRAVQRLETVLGRVGAYYLSSNLTP